LRDADSVSINVVREPEDKTLLIGIVGEEQRVLDSDIDGGLEAGRLDGVGSNL
jgi:hypothetical protein